MEKSIELNGIDLAGIRDCFGEEELDIRSFSPLTLAYIGDVVYELIIRSLVVGQGNAPVNKLHKRSSLLVNAKTQAVMAKKLEEILTEEEFAIYKRGRNAKSYTSAKNASVIEYRVATGFEALIGYLFMSGRTNRMYELIKYALPKNDQ